LTVGAAIRDLRITKGWTQEALASQVPGLDAAALSRLENGVWGSRGPTYERLSRISKALGVSLPILLSRVVEGKRAKGNGTSVQRRIRRAS
jgi:transcriptional regulator with XRE-family HTH domain